MRQNHRAGEKLFVDHAGQTVPVIDRTTGEIHEAQVFVAVMGASNYTYAEATWSQTLPDWIGSHIRTFEFLGGVPELVVPVNATIRELLERLNKRPFRKLPGCRLDHFK
jgi:transposase